MLHQRVKDLSLVHFLLRDYFDSARHFSVDIACFVDFAELACTKLLLKGVLLLNIIDFMESLHRLKLHESFCVASDSLRVFLDILDTLNLMRASRNRDRFWLRRLREFVEIFK